MCSAHKTVPGILKMGGILRQSFWPSGSYSLLRKIGFTNETLRRQISERVALKGIESNLLNSPFFLGEKSESQKDPNSQG